MQAGWVSALVLTGALVMGCGGERAAAPLTADPTTGSATGSVTASDSASQVPKKKLRSPGSPAATKPADPPTRDPLADAVEGLSAGVDEPVLGADISWPQCPVGMGIAQKRSKGAPPPVAEARYVVIGLTNGPGFYPNPCLAEQVDDVRRLGRLAAAYSVVSYPEPQRLTQHADDGPYDGSTRLGALANNGYAQARFNLRNMRAAGLLTPVIWIDVEPVPDFEWSGDKAANAMVVEGMARGYREAGFEIGVYSTTYLWSLVVGDYAIGVPEWRAAGQTSRAAALAQCEPEKSIQGGEAVLGQWVEIGRDMNVTCPGISLEMERWFHQY